MGGNIGGEMVRWKNKKLGILGQRVIWELGWLGGVIGSTDRTTRVHTAKVARKRKPKREIED